MEIQIGHSSTNKQASETLVMAVVTHVLPLFGPLKVGTLHWRKVSLKKYQNARSFSLSQTSNLYQQKQFDVVSKNAANIYPSNKYDLFPICLLLTNHETLYNLNIVILSHFSLF